MSVRLVGKSSDQDLQKNLESLANDINRTSDELSANVTGAGEIAVAHGLNYKPTSFYQCVTSATTGQGVLYPGTTVWDKTNIYVRATSIGLYHLRVRR
jgi:hypothetical protein